MVWLIVLFIALIVFFFCFLKHKKCIRLGSLSLITGGVKNGKSTLSVYLAIREYKRAYRSYRLARFLFGHIRPLKKFVPIEPPYLYSNVPLAGIDFVPLTTDILLRRKRVSAKSVVYVQEASLFADSQLKAEMEINDNLLLFCKLFGHESHGGKLIFDTQNITDCHYSVKRATSTYLWLYPVQKFPFFLRFNIREMFHDESGDVHNVFDSDVEDSMKHFWISKRVWKKFDAYCYSCLTDNLPLENRVYYIDVRRRYGKLKAHKIITFNKRFELIFKDQKLLGSGIHEKRK